MPEYQTGDRVQLTEECGASIGTIHYWSGGPKPEGEYHLMADWHARLEGATSAGPAQIAALLEAAPPAAVFAVGQAVILGTRPGVVVELGPDDLVPVDVQVELTKLRFRRRNYLGRTVYTRRHRCPSWMLKLENR